MSFETFIGFVAAFCTTVAYVPQAIKVYKTKKTKDISLGMFILMVVGVSSWLTYGIMLDSAPMIFANSVTLVLTFYIFTMKVLIDHKKHIGISGSDHTPTIQ